MTAILYTESRMRVRESLVIVGAFGLLSAFLFAAFPAFSDQAELIEDAFPEPLVALFGFEAMHTYEGFLGGYSYPMLIVLFAGIYFAYTSAGMIADDIRTRKMDLTLASPVSRESVVLQKVGALWVPLVILTVGVALINVIGALVLGESLDPHVLLMVHLLSVPYLLCCAGIGLVLSVWLERSETAEIGALGIVFVLWLVEGLADMSPDFSWVGYLTPSRYYDPSAILVHGEFALLEGGVLLGAFFGLLAIATIRFLRRDI